MQLKWAFVCILILSTITVVGANPDEAWWTGEYGYPGLQSTDTPTCDADEAGDIYTDSQGRYYCVKEGDTIGEIYHDSNKPDLDIPKEAAGEKDGFPSENYFIKYNGIPLEQKDDIWPGQKLYIRGQLDPSDEEQDGDTEESEDGSPDDKDQEKEQEADGEQKKDNTDRKDSNDTSDQDDNDSSKKKDKDDDSQQSRVGTEELQDYYETNAQNIPFCLFLQTNREHIKWDAEKKQYKVKEGASLKKDFRASASKPAFNLNDITFLNGDESLLKEIFTSSQREELEKTLTELYDNRSVLMPVTIVTGVNDITWEELGRQKVHSPDWCLSANGEPNVNAHIMVNASAKKNNEVFQVFLPPTDKKDSTLYKKININTQETKIRKADHENKGKHIVSAFKEAIKQIKSIRSQEQGTEKTSSLSVRGVIGKWLQKNDIAIQDRGDVSALSGEIYGYGDMGLGGWVAGSNCDGLQNDKLWIEPENNNCMVGCYNYQKISTVSILTKIDHLSCLDITNTKVAETEPGVPPPSCFNLRPSRYHHNGEVNQEHPCTHQASVAWEKLDGQAHKLS